VQEFSSKLRELLVMAEQTPGFYEVEITFSIRLHEGSESYYLRLMSDADKVALPGSAPSPGSAEKIVGWF